MAKPSWLVSCDLLMDRSGKPENPDGSREYTTYYRVIVNHKNVGSKMICKTAGTGLPLQWSSYLGPHADEKDLFSLLVSKEATLEYKDDWQSWIVTCNYTTNIPRGGPQPAGSENNPENELPEIDWDFDVKMRFPEVDLDGMEFLNSAGCSNIPRYQEEYASAVLVYTRNELNFDKDKATNYAFSVNSDTFLGSPPGDVKCMPPRARMSSRGNSLFWKVTYKMAFFNDPGGKVDLVPRDAARLGAAAPGGKIKPNWQPLILDQGLTELDAAGKHIPIFLKAANTITHQPLCLDGQGRYQQPIPVPPGLRPITPYYHYRRTKIALPFNLLLSAGLS